MNYGPRIVKNGLLLALDAGDRNSYIGTGTNWIDMSGNGYNGTLTNGPTFDSANGGSLVYDGINDFINMGDVLDLISSNISGFSWVNITTFKDYTGIIDKLTGNGNYRLHVNSNKDVVFGIRNTSGAYEQHSTPISLTNIWYYLGFTHNITTKVSKIFVNGVLKSSFTHTIDRGDTATNLNLGYASNNAVYGNFKQATVCIYNRELSASEVLQNYNATKLRFGL